MITVRIRTISMIAVVALAGVVAVARETDATVPNLNATTDGVGSSESAAIPPSAIAVAGVDSEHPRMKFDAFRAALDGYRTAVQNRIRKPGAESDARLQTASRQLTGTGRTFLESIRNATEEADRSKALKDIDEFDDSGKRLVIAADDQRALLLDYSNRVRAMTARTREAIDDAWMLFGRVFARDSLVSLKAELAELRRRSEHLEGLRGSELDTVLEGLAAAEQAIEATLEGDRSELTKSQGRVWFENMREDLASLSETRTKLQRTDVHQSVMATRFADVGSRLERPMKLVSRFARAEPASQELQVQLPAPVSETAPPASQVVEAAIEAPPSVLPPQSADERRRVVGWVAVAVLMLFGLAVEVRRRRARSSTFEIDMTDADSMATTYDRVAERLTHAEQTLAELESLSPRSEKPLSDLRESTEHIGPPGERSRISVSFDDTDRRAPKRAPPKTRDAGSAVEPAPCGENLLRMLENEAFELALQPEMNADTLEVESVLARVSMRGTDAGLGARGEILTLPDEPEVILRIGAWALRSAMETTARWHHQGTWPQARMSMDVSPEQLAEANFVERTKAWLDEFQLPSHCFEIGISDAALRDIETRNDDVLRRLCALGVGVALNDFGKSYSPLAWLERMPLTRIKLDPSLANEVDAGLRSPVIARNLIGWARRVGLCVTQDSIGAPEQFALALREVSSCSLRHFVRLDRADSDEVDPQQEHALSYRSVVVFRQSLVLKQFEPGLRDESVTRTASQAE